MKRSIHKPTLKDIMEAIAWAIIVFVAFIVLLWATSNGAWGQSVTRNGNVFIQSTSNSPIKKDTATLTKYFYMTSDGTKYPIYMSSTGKCFILRTSAKTGKQYKQYLPEVTKQLSGK